MTVRAVRVSEPLDIDGRLDELVYTTVPPISDFIQQEPQEGEPATEKTDAWILFDDRNLYISARCWDSHPEREIADEMRRDSLGVLENEAFGVLLDTFYDRRNGVHFTVNALGGMFDGTIADDRQMDANWNAVWGARTSRFESGWTVEIVIPLKSLRYGTGREQVWGVNLRRIVRWKNERSNLTRIPAFLGRPGVLTPSLAATMVGVEVTSAGLNLDLKPYAIAGLRTSRISRPQRGDATEGDVGFDAKWGITKSLTADFTYNTDFAQVEDDLQQVNLTQFNLFFPERRDFFLEGQNIFAFAGVTAGGTVGGAAGGKVNNTPVLFFSRRIGLNNGRPLPIVGGGRITGKIGAYSIGVLNIQSGDEPAADAQPTNFSVLRIKRDIFSRSNIGALYTRRAETEGGREAGETFGVDALYSLSNNLNINAYVARTRTPGVPRDDTSHLVRFDYNTDRYGVQVERLSVGAGFNPKVGFLRRTDFQRQFALARFSPRPARTHIKAIRRFVYQGSVEYFENGAGRVDMREIEGSFAVELLNSESLTVSYTRDYEFIPRPFAIAPSVTVPMGAYDYQSGRVSYLIGRQRSFPERSPTRKARSMVAQSERSASRAAVSRCPRSSP